MLLIIVEFVIDVTFVIHSLSLYPTICTEMRRNLKNKVLILQVPI